MQQCYDVVTFALDCRLQTPYVVNRVQFNAAQVPGVYLLTTYWRDDLVGLYSGMAIGYLVLMMLYGYIIVTR